MDKTSVLKCEGCGSILIVPNKLWYSTRMACTICQHPLKKLDDDFELSEIIEEDK